MTNITLKDDLIEKVLRIFRIHHPYEEISKRKVSQIVTRILVEYIKNNEVKEIGKEKERK